MESYYIVEFNLQIMAAAVGLPSLDLYLLSQLFLAVLAVVGWLVQIFFKVTAVKHYIHELIHVYAIAFYKIKNCQQVANNT